jgi:beta-galactosidase
VLSHDLEPNRAYAEVSRTAHELQKVGPHVANLKIQNQVAILYSVDSANAIDFMPFSHGPGSQWSFSPPVASYSTLLDQLHGTLYRANVGVDFVFPETADFANYKVLVIPPLYIADDALLEKIASYVQQGGHVLMAFKSGFANENSMVRWVRQPGPLREAAGFSYQEFSNLSKPLALRGDPWKLGDHNRVQYWAEFLQLEHAKALAFYDHPFFGQWPAVTHNEFGSGTLTYEGTYLSDELQRAVVLDVLKEAGLLTSDQQLPAPVRAKHGVNAMGKRLDYYLNYSSDVQKFVYGGVAGTDLLTGNAIGPQTPVELKPWDLVIVEEN